MDTPLLLHVTTNFEPGGAEVRTADLMAALGTEFRHAVVALSGRAGMARRVPPDVELRILPRPAGSGTLQTALGFRDLFRRERPDLVLTYNWGAIEAAMGAALAGQPFIHAEDGFGADEAAGLKRRRVWTRRLVLARARRVVVPSRLLERIALTRYRVEPGRLSYIPNGIDTTRFRPGPREEARSALGLGDAGFVIAAIGGLRPEKGLDLLLEAFALFLRGEAASPDARLLLVGGGPCRDELMGLAARLGIAPQVIFTGPAGDTAPYYRALDVFCLSSLTEQMSLSLLEAMASGRAAICADVGDCALMLGDTARDSILPRRDAPSLASAWTRLALDPALRAAIGEANRHRCLRHYSRDRMIAAYRDLYLTSAVPQPR